MVMRRQKMMLVILGGVLASFWIGAYVGAATNNVDPGSVGDPIITKSYLEERLSEVAGNGTTSEKTVVADDIVALQNQIAELQAKNKELEQELSLQKKELAKSSFKKVTVKSGKTLVMKYGTEMIFYSGKGNFKTSNSKYIVDLTNQNHVSNGEEAILYHKYFIRSGCNLEATKDTIVYVQGTYSIK